MGRTLHHGFERERAVTHGGHTDALPASRGVAAQIDHDYARISVANAAALITSPISTFTSTRVRDGSFDPEAVGSRTLALTCVDAARFGPAAALARPDPA